MAVRIGRGRRRLRDFQDKTQLPDFTTISTGCARAAHVVADLLVIDRSICA
jgi:hypothetical protein